MTTTHEIVELCLVEMDKVNGGSIFGDLLTLGGLHPLRQLIDSQPALPHGNANGQGPTISGPVGA
jgi:hypothetical protein